MSETPKASRKSPRQKISKYKLVGRLSGKKDHFVFQVPDPSNILWTLAKMNELHEKALKDKDVDLEVESLQEEESEESDEEEEGDEEEHSSDKEFINDEEEEEGEEDEEEEQ